MADFNSGFWHWYVTVLTVVALIACFWLVRWMSDRSGDDPSEVDDTGHTWDGDLREWNNPLPRWWLGLFYITLIFSVIYLGLYPGRGSFSGVLGWSQVSQYETEVQEMEAKTGPLFARLVQQDIPTLAKSSEAVEIGGRLYAAYCIGCHGSDAGGARGYPNLRDADWIWGGSPEQIKTTILNGRIAAMPAWGAALGDQGIKEVTQYVISLSGRNADAALAEAGKTKYGMFCIACHGAEGKGNPILGAPNLTDDIWLYGGSEARIAESLLIGRNGQMPAYGEFLGEDKIHVLSAYVYSLSN